MIIGCPSSTIGITGRSRSLFLQLFSWLNKIEATLEDNVTETLHFFVVLAGVALVHAWELLAKKLLVPLNAILEDLEILVGVFLEFAYSHR
jgi:hypothetical protein